MTETFDQAAHLRNAVQLYLFNSCRALMVQTNLILRPLELVLAECVLRCHVMNSNMNLWRYCTYLICIVTMSHLMSDFTISPHQQVV